MLSVQEISPSKRKVSLEQLINRLNTLHFQDDTLLICLRHTVHEYQIRLRATPTPSHDAHVKAVWERDDSFPPDLTAFRLEKVLIPGPRRTLEFAPLNYWLDEDAVHLDLPERAQEVSGRKVARFACQNNFVRVELAQSSVVFSGELIDFSPKAMRAKVEAASDQSFHWLNPSRPATLTLRKNGVQIYSGPVGVNCRELELETPTRCYILTPLEDSTPRILPKKHRTRREAFKPSPDLIFEHPITGRVCCLKIHDLAGQGFAVDEDPDNPVLLAGLLIPNARISFANSLCLSCKVQVVYHGRTTEHGLRSGLVLLDISVQDHLKLIGLIQQAQDEKSYVSSHIDAESLFEFFFETGFLYPHKYAEIAGNREGFRKAYRRLYEEDTDIARHFIYLDANRILGHFSTIRVYKNTWMNQHHAAVPSSRAGLKVVRAISEYMNDSFSLNPSSLRYIIGFYRPENKFPAKYFGGFVEATHDSSKTSLDTFGYVAQASHLGLNFGDLTGQWELAKAGKADIAEFVGFYEKVSGGLLPEVFDLTVHGFHDQTIEEVYRNNSLQRQRQIYAVRHNRALKALVEVQDSDLGLNLSELTNAMFVYVLDQTAFRREIMEFVLSALAVKHQKMNHPVMFFPQSYTDKFKIKTDKIYTLWALDVKYHEEYMTWMERFCCRP